MHSKYFKTETFSDTGPNFERFVLKAREHFGSEHVAFVECANKICTTRIVYHTNKPGRKPVYCSRSCSAVSLPQQEAQIRQRELTEGIRTYGAKNVIVLCGIEIGIARESYSAANWCVSIQFFLRACLIDYVNRIGVKEYVKLIKNYKQLKINDALRRDENAQ